MGWDSGYIGQSQVSWLDVDFSVSLQKHVLFWCTKGILVLPLLESVTHAAFSQQSKLKSRRRMKDRRDSDFTPDFMLEQYP